MFANFEKAFFPRKEIGKKIPNEVLKSLSEKLPDGFVYTSISEDAAGITPLSSEVNIEGFSIQMPENLPKNFKPTTWDEFSQFIYRTQQKLKIILDEDNCLTINGNRFKVEDVIEFPFSDSNSKDIELFIIPEPFQSPFPILLEGNGVNKTLIIKRQPYPDLHKSLFKSIDNSSFEISYMIDEETQNLTFNLKTNIEHATSIQDVIDTLKLYYSFIKGTIKLNNEQLPKPNEVELEDESIIKTIEFWEKVQKVESFLPIKFLPEPQTGIDDIILIEALYRSLNERQPFKEYININDLTIQGYQGDTITDIINAEGLSFQFIQTSNVELLGAEFELYSVYAFFDFIVNEVEKINDNEAKLTIQPIEGRKTFQSVIHFSTYEEAKNYIEQNNTSELYNARTLPNNN